MDLVKVCGDCGVEKPLSAFYSHSRNGKDGRHSQCIPCMRKQKKKEYHLKDSETRRDDRTRRKYGVSIVELIKLHGRKCMICEDTENLHVDHDHETKKVRGILCGPCNQALGHFEDNIELLERAIEYLRKSCS